MKLSIQRKGESMKKIGSTWYLLAAVTAAAWLASLLFASTTHADCGGRGLVLSAGSGCHGGSCGTVLFVPSATHHTTSALFLQQQASLASLGLNSVPILSTRPAFSRRNITVRAPGVFVAAGGRRPILVDVLSAQIASRNALLASQFRDPRSAPVRLRGVVGLGERARIRQRNRQLEQIIRANNRQLGRF